MLHSLQEREVYESVMGNLRCFLFLSVGFTEGIRSVFVFVGKREGERERR